MIAHEESLVKMEMAFQEVMGFVKQSIASKERRLDEVERGVFDGLLVAGLRALETVVVAAGDGDHGETAKHHGKTLQRSEEKKTKPYRSIFGRRN